MYNVATCQGQIKDKQILLEDVLIKRRQGFLKMTDGEIIRIGQIVSVDGISLIKGTSCGFLIKT